MITVIATGFDGGRRKASARQESTGVMDSTASGRPTRERDFLEELQRQRDEVADLGGYGSAHLDEEATAAVAVPRLERSVGEPVRRAAAPAYDADDLEIPSFLRRK
jgi:hypothetical protein